MSDAPEQQQQQRVGSQAGAENVDLAAALELAVSLARKAGSEIKQAWGDGTARHADAQTNAKSHATDLVTEVDARCEDLILNGLKEKYPSHRYVAEEAISAAGGVGESLEAGPCWVVDPLDGTANFVHRIPFVSVSIGLVINFKCVLGVVFNPITDEMFTARDGAGAYLNGVKISVSLAENLVDAMVGIASGQGESQISSGTEFMTRMRTVIKRCRSWRRCGSAAIDMAYVACGKLDLYMERGPHAWDVAAGCAILAEAGGVSTGIDGSKLDICSGHIMAANANLGPVFLAALAEDDALESGAGGQ